MMKVSDFMTKDVVTCTVDQTVEVAAKLMAEKGFSVMPIVDEEANLVGIITESDFVGRELNVPHALASIKQLFGQTFYFQDVEKIYSETKGKKLSSIMTSKIHSIAPEASLNDVINFMISKKLKRLPVVEGKKIVGIITRKDLLKAFLETN
jgi:CBS domain-containing protein